MTTKQMMNDDNYDLESLLGKTYYEELKTQQLYAKVAKGEYMPPFYDWLKQVSPHMNWDWKYMRYMIDHLQRFVDGDIRKLMIFLPPRSGKLQLHETPVYTPNGWKTHGELKQGDFVYHPSGKAIRVITVSEEMQCDMNITFSSGETITTHSNHEWEIYDRYSQKTTVTETKNIYPEKHCVYNQYTNTRFDITNIEKIENGGMGKCIQVDSPDGMYLVGKTLIPTHNSELASIHFPVYFLEKDPTNRIILASYNATLAQKMSRRVRGLAKTRIELDPDRKSMEEWDTKQGGGLRAIGVEGGIAGVGANCLVGNTKVTTEIGNISISDLYLLQEYKPKALSYNLESKKTEYKNILATKRSLTQELFIIKTSNNRKIEATGEHLFFTERGYIRARSLTKKDKLLSSNLFQDRITFIEKIQVYNEPVYDIQVEDNHNFFAENILVHNCIIIDDPVRSRKAASSVTVRNSTYSWWTDDIFSRREPDSRILLIQTRWHESDLAGMILDNEKDWTVISLPALAEENDPLGRQVGEALNPDRYDRDALLEIQHVMGRGFYALYQQRPQEQEGEFFKASWFEKLDKLPELNPGEKYEYVRFWDKAGTLDGDFTVGTLLVKNRSTGYYYVVDVVRGQWLPHTRDAMMLRTAQRDQENYGSVRTYHEEEPGSSGKDAARQTNQLLAGYPVKAIRSTGNKQLRAEPYQSQCEGKNVFIIRGDWNPDFIDEHATFPNGAHDDIVDASAGAFTQLSKGRGSISISNRFK